MLGYLPRSFVALSCIFFAYHFCPVAVLFVCLAMRIFLELFYYFLSMDSLFVSVSSIFLIGHGLLYFAKILVDSTCDFLSFQVSSDAEYVNNNARTKLLRYLSWTRAVGLPYSMLLAAVMCSASSILYFNIALLREANLDWFCVGVVVTSLSHQLLYAAWYAREPAVGAKDVMHDPERWNFMVYHMRAAALLYSIVAFLVAPLLKFYSYGGIEPFLCVSAGQTLFYMLLRLSSEGLETIGDIVELYTPFARLIYTSTILASAVLMHMLTGSIMAAVIIAMCSNAWIRSSLDCASSIHHIRPLLFRLPGRPVLFSIWGGLTCILMVVVLPLLPCAVSLVAFTAPPLVALPCAAIFVALLVFPPAPLSDVAGQIVRTMTGAPLFHSKLSSSTVRFDRSTALALIAVPLWAFVLFSQAGLVDEALHRAPVESYFYSPVSSTHADFKFTVMNETIVNVAYTLGTTTPTNVHQPPICALRVHDIALPEMSLLAAVSYLKPGSTDFNAFKSSLLPGWQVREIARADQSPVAFVDLYSPDRNVSVISIKGTHAARVIDWIQDFDLWVEPAMFHALSIVVPGLRVWPDGILARIFQGISRVGAFLPMTREALLRHRLYHVPVQEYARSISDRNVVIVGHSLGGGLAQVVGATLGLPAVSFSGPGLMESRNKFRLTRQNLVDTVINVIPSHDLVPLAGALGGTVVNWDCLHDAFACHMPMVAPCGMHALCPREQPRPLNCTLTNVGMTISQALSSLT
eukprot:m.58737 g.58737  ORF g.58737 m.58737 type:complete len:748 (-) comp6922_c0_seq2:121-2364(-)